MFFLLRHKFAQVLPGTPNLFPGRLIKPREGGRLTVEVLRQEALF